MRSPLHRGRIASPLEAVTTFGAYLRQLREDRGLYQVEVARRVGVQQPYYAKLERGEKAPKMARVRLLIKALEVEDQRRFIRLAVLANIPAEWRRHFAPISGRHL
jgi:transcriptional regulator with XRE-family HTH domain